VNTGKRERERERDTERDRERGEEENNLVFSRKTSH
jgi:hypothetical protein